MGEAADAIGNDGVIRADREALSAPFAPSADSLRQPATWGRFLILGALAMAFTFPYQMITSVIPALYRAEGLALESFWVFSLILVPFWLKFLWASWVDDNGWIRFGLRKTWIVACGLLGAASISLLGAVEPTLDAVWIVVGIATLHAIAIATMDIAIDAYTIENLARHERSAGTGIKTLGEALADFIALAGLMRVYDVYGWHTAMPLAGLLLITFSLPAILRREPSPPAAVLMRKQSGDRASIWAFLKRKDSRLIMPLLITGGFVQGAFPPIAGAFLVDQGLSITEIGIVMGTAYSTANLAGGMLAAVIATIWSVRTAIFLAAVTALVGYTFLGFVAQSGSTDVWMLILAFAGPVAALNAVHFCYTLGRMNWSSAAQAGTDFSLQGTLYNIGRTLAGMVVGLGAALLGWASFHFLSGMIFVATAALFWLWTPRVEQLVADHERLVVR